MYYTVTGAKFFVSTGFAGAKNITTATNANPPVITSVAHGYVDNDEILFTSGWEELNSSVFRVDQLTADTLSPLNFDATNTDLYPAGSGTGTMQKVSGWLELGQVLGVQGGGGDARNITVRPLNRRNDVNIPTGFNAATLSFELGFDPALADQVALQAASRSLAKRAFKFVLPGGAFAYCYGTVSMSPVPTFNADDVLRRNVSIGIDGIFTFF